MAVSISFISVLLVLVLVLITVGLIVSFVYQDARKRDMNPLLWSLLAALLPFFIGIILYLLCRNPLVDLQCAKCGAGLNAESKVCPKCGNKILTTCPTCEFPVQKGWTACPKCGTAFPEEFARPVQRYKKDNTGIAIAIVIVLVVIALGVVGYTMFSTVGKVGFSTESYSGYEGIYNISKEDMKNNPTIMQWIEESNQSEEKAHVLLSTTSNICLVYIKEEDMLLTNTVDVEYSGDKCYMHCFVDQSEYEDVFGYDFVMYQMNVLQDTTVEVIHNGNRCDTKVTMTEAAIDKATWGGEADE